MGPVKRLTENHWRPRVFPPPRLRILLLPLPAANLTIEVLPLAH